MSFSGDSERTVRAIANNAYFMFFSRAMAAVGVPVFAGLFLWFISMAHTYMRQSDVSAQALITTNEKINRIQGTQDKLSDRQYSLESRIVRLEAIVQQGKQ